MVEVLRAVGKEKTVITTPINFFGNFFKLISYTSLPLLHLIQVRCSQYLPLKKMFTFFTCHERQFRPTTFDSDWINKIICTKTTFLRANLFFIWPIDTHRYVHTKDNLWGVLIRALSTTYAVKQKFHSHFTSFYHLICEIFLFRLLAYNTQRRKKGHRFRYRNFAVYSNVNLQHIHVQYICSCLHFCMINNTHPEFNKNYPIPN